MEENKKCCENGKCEKCNMCCGLPQCCMLHKCRGMKYLIWAIIIVVVFCLGAQWGMMKSSIRGYHLNSGKMMNWDSERFENKFDKDGAKTVDSETVETQLPPKQ